MEQEFIQAFKEAIEREGNINLEDAFRNYEEWGSLAYLSVLAMIDENYGVQIELDDFKKLVTVRDLMDEVFKRSGRL